MAHVAQRPAARRHGRWLAHGLYGFCIGAADLVPGVSGSTVAVLFGVYEHLLGAVHRVAGALHRVLRGDLQGAWRHLRGVEWALVVPVAAGAAAALVALSGAVDWLLTFRAEAMAGAFCGLVCAAVVVATRQVRPWNPVLGTVCVATAVASGWLFGLSASPVPEPAPVVYFGAGVLGVCAMILPGVSGSFVLLIIGLYASYIDALSHRDWTPLALLGAGVVVGALAFSSLLGRLLERRGTVVMAVLVGLMLGSLRVLWPWPDGVGILGGPGDEAISGTGLVWPGGREAIWPVVCAVTAFVLAVAASRAAERSGRATDPKPGLLEAP